MSIIKISNDELVVEIESYGAEIKSVKDKNGKEYIWCGNPDIWDGQAPILFPIVSTLRNDRYSFCGKEYEMGMHGFAAESDFEIENADKSSVTFLLVSSVETRKTYPFDFEFRVKYVLDGKKLSVEFLTDNKTDGEMYYSVGSHEGYAINGNINNYSIVLDEAETLGRYEILPSGGLSSEPKPCFENSSELKLDDEYFAVDGIIFFDIKSRGIALRDDRNGETIHVAFPGFETLLIWKVPGAEYVCIEPWAGAPEVPWNKYTDFSEKFRIRMLEKGESEKFVHTITF